jgi:stalled ribosome rescue protein Dom34
VALGNPDRLRDADLQVAAWEATASVRQRARRAALDRFAALAGTGRTVHEPEPVAAAAAQGRIETLLVAPATELPRDVPAAIQAVDEAIRATLRHRGDVHVVPGRAGLDPDLPAAIVRF